MITLVLASRNQHKAQEIQAILGADFRLRTLRDFPGAPATVEDADTFAGNAAKKAVELAGWLADAGLAGLGQVKDTEVFTLADDSGLEVDALGGAPGVYSARFAAMDSGVEGNSPDAANNAKLLRLLTQVPAEQRTARFRCAIALAALSQFTRRTGAPAIHQGKWESQCSLFEGTCEGVIDFSPRGAGGFGYDPLFIPRGFAESFAELSADAKNRISHRARALAGLRQYFAARTRP